mgnify:CR=1 FL=1
MEKKKMILLALILIVLITGIVTIKVIDVFKNKKTSESLSLEICEKYSNDFDKGLKTFMSHDEYKSYTDDKQIEIMNEFLKCYENKGKIKGLTYVEETKIFEFKDETGASRGIMMKDFNESYN